MADAEYKRLTVGASLFKTIGKTRSIDGCVKDSWSLAGLCLDHANRAKHIKHKLICAHCSKEYEALRMGSMYCSNNCNQAAWVKRNPEKMIARLKNKPDSVRSFACENCKAEFTAVRKRKFCHSRCSWLVNEKKYRDKALSEWRKAGKTVACKGCSACFCPLYGYFTRAVYCSVCSVSIPASAWSVRRRERIKAASVEVVSRQTVFERDKWRCAMCGIKTIKQPYQHNSAELDHIVPLSLGGKHSYDNTQCSCRKCNGSKHAKARGQMLLFG